MINHSQQTTDTIDGLSYIAILICRYTEIEKLYLRDDCLTEASALAAETVKSYRSVLEFQVKIICQFDRSGVHQFVRNLVEVDGWKEQLERIRSQEATCEKLRVLLDTEDRRQAMESVESRLREIDAETHKHSDGILSELNASRENQNHWHVSQVESKCLHSLRTLDYESDKARFTDRMPGTCQWFLSHHRYQSWLHDTRTRLLWVSADPGCGKTVLSKFLVNSFIDDAAKGATSVCYFFFRDSSEKNQDGDNALCALLHQLFRQKRLLIKHALPDFECNGSKLSGLFENLWSIFLRAAEDPLAGCVICILDALDKCGAKTCTALLKHIGALVSERHESMTLKFIITSRPYGTIMDTLWESYPDVSSVRLMGEDEHEMSIIQTEISQVIDQRVERLRQKRQQWSIYDEAHSAISRRLSQTENRTYLWVSLVFAELDKNARSSRGTLLQVIEAIPSSLQEAYERILSNSTNAAKTKKILHFILAAQRPLTLGEMNTAIAITEECTSVGQLELDPERTFQETLSELCGLFVFFSDSRIYLIHQTAREFLLARESNRELVSWDTGAWMYSMDYQTSHFELAKTCLMYLHLSGVQCHSQVITYGDEENGERKPRSSVDRQAFRAYSANHWYHHVSQSAGAAVDSLMDLMLSTTRPESQAFKIWIAFGFKRLASTPDFQKPNVANYDQLSVTAYFGIEPVLSLLLKAKQHQPDQKPVVNGAATCTIKYCPAIFHFFLRNGLDINAQTEDSISFMHEAARCEMSKSPSF